MDPTDSANLRIPAVLFSSYKNIIKTPSGRADLKRISVRCGVCRLLRYYSLTRGITRINRVVACEACRHCYQAYKREPVPLHCTKGDGSCWRNLMFPKTKCRCCWITQMVERTPISQALYSKIMPLLPEYIRIDMRGHSILGSQLTISERGFLTLEVHTGTDWRDVTLEEAVSKQRMSLTDGTSSAADEGGLELDASAIDEQENTEGVTSSSLKNSGSSTTAAAGTDNRMAEITSGGNVNDMALPPPPVKSVATRGKRGGKFKSSSSVYSSFLSKSNTVPSTASDGNSSESENQSRSSGVARSKATKGSRGGSKRGRIKRGGQTKVDRVMAGIKEGLYGLSMSEDSGAGLQPSASTKRQTGPTSAFSGAMASSNTTSDSSGPNSTATSPTPMEEDVTVEEFEEGSLLRSKLPPDPMIGLLHDEQKKYLKDFNPRNSARVRRKKDRLEYFDNPKPQKTVETLVHDHKGRFVGADRELHDNCDCLQLDCPGCHFPCPKCRSPKCGAECRTNRKWFYDRVDIEGTEQFFVNRFTKA